MCKTSVHLPHLDWGPQGQAHQASSAPAAPDPGPSPAPELQVSWETPDRGRSFPETAGAWHPTAHSPLPQGLQGKAGAAPAHLLPSRLHGGSAGQDAGKICQLLPCEKHSVEEFERRISYPAFEDRCSLLRRGTGAKHISPSVTAQQLGDRDPTGGRGASEPDQVAGWREAPAQH